jgi:hypothetical protein
MIAYIGPLMVFVSWVGFAILIFFWLLPRIAQLEADEKELRDGLEKYQRLTGRILAAGGRDRRNWFDEMRDHHVDMHCLLNKNVEHVETR